MHHRWLILAQETIGALLLVAGSALAQLPALPRGLAFPTEPAVTLPDPFRPPARCASCGPSEDELQLHDRDYAGHRVALDLYAPRWTADLLVLEHGYQEIWHPAQAYRLYAAGPQGQPDYVQFLGRQMHVLFQRVNQPDGTIAMKCLSHPDFRLARAGSHVMVEQRGRQRWYFGTPDFGVTWRLERLEEPAFPGMAVTLGYEGDRLATLTYPDGKQATLGHEGQRLATIRLPNGYFAKLGHDPAGYLASVALHGPATQPASRKLDSFTVRGTASGVASAVHYREEKPAAFEVLRLYHYENDALGRIHHFVNACGDAFQVDYARQDDGATPVFLITVTDQASGDYRFLRHRAEGTTWVLEHGHGQREQPLDRATVDERRVKVKDGYRMATREVQFGQHEPIKIAVGKTAGRGVPGTATSQSSLTTGVKAQAADAAAVAAAGRQLATASITPTVAAAGSPANAPPAAAKASAPTFEYDDRGLPRLVRHEGREWELRFDALGRPERCQAVGGTLYVWTYTPTGLLETRTITRPGAPAPELTTWRYDRHQRLSQIALPDRRERRYEWGCQGLEAYTKDAEPTVKYRYDEQRRLRRRILPDEEERYDYLPDGKLHRRTRRASSQTYQLTYHYSADGRCEAVTGQDPRFPASDRTVARSARHYAPDHTYRDEAYNARGLLLAITGTREPAREFHYTPDGRPLPPAATPAASPTANQEQPAP